MSVLPDWPVLLAYTGAVVLLTLTPGPDMALYVGRTLAHGRAAGFAAFLGTAAGLVCHAVFAAVGLSALVAASAAAFTALKIAGALYLLFLAVQAVRKGSAFAPAEGAGEARPSLARSFLTGFLVNVLNPKIVLFFLTFLPQFVDAADPQAAAKLFVLGLWYIPVTLPPTIAMILGASALAAALKARPAIMRALDWLFAGVMGAFAVRLLATRTG
ncbi:LysE family translocator [Chthonobacter rhizosphaerae]|uniref:LysE family translocator n=1 Tax=Chthonobacter rhizosphaerae TaxID=2735553 RepID=UPI0015EFAF56|nr:LysE family translocator [Chthonobacter rhizosphaerae]